MVTSWVGRSYATAERMHIQEGVLDFLPIIECIDVVLQRLLNIAKLCSMG